MAKKEAALLNFIVIVEGYFDVISLHRWAGVT
jgi:DNA primase